MSDVMRVLQRAGQGDLKAATELLPLVYQELRRLAAHKLASESPSNTLQPTALVHEAWLKLAGDDNRRFNDRTHFFAASAEAMRRILIDNARRKLAQRHGGGLERVEFDGIELPHPAKEEELFELNDALEKLEKLDPRRAEVVKLRFFVGLTFEETAEILGISVPTARRHWSFARAWLHAEIERERK